MNLLPKHFAVALAVPLLHGCSSIYMASGSKGVDVAPVVPGALAGDVKNVLGDPIREWRNEHGVTFRLYEFDGGRAGHLGYALFSGLFSVASLGLWEILMTKVIENEKRSGISRTRVRLVVSFDASDLVLGVFEEFDDLPADGRRLAEAR